MFTEAIIIRERCNYCIQSLSEVTKPLHRTRRPFPFILYSNSIQFHFRLEKMELQQIEREREEWKKIAQTNKPNEKLVAHDAEYGIVLIITIIIIILKGSFSLFNIYLSCIVLSHEKKLFRVRHFPALPILLIASHKKWTTTTVECAFFLSLSLDVSLYFIYSVQYWHLARHIIRQ